MSKIDDEFAAWTALNKLLMDARECRRLFQITGDDMPAPLLRILAEPPRAPAPSKREKSIVGENAELYVVVCLGDSVDGASGSGAYELATRTVFASKEAANAYADGVNVSRRPIVVQGRWHGLRFGEERGGWQ